jgi:hypothetical protein
VGATHQCDTGVDRRAVTAMAIRDSTQQT